MILKSVNIIITSKKSTSFLSFQKRTKSSELTQDSTSTRIADEFNIGMPRVVSPADRSKAMGYLDVISEEELELDRIRMQSLSKQASEPESDVMTKEEEANKKPPLQRRKSRVLEAAKTYEQTLSIAPSTMTALFEFVIIYR